MLRLPFREAMAYCRITLSLYSLVLALERKLCCRVFHSISPTATHQQGFSAAFRGALSKAISRASIDVTEALQFVSSLVVADVESYGLEGSNGIDIEEAVGAETLAKEAG